MRRPFGLRHLLISLIGLTMIAAGNAPASGEAGPGFTVEVVLETALGDVTLDIYLGRAPLTATNFLKYVEGGHFDGSNFYRVMRPDNDRAASPLTIIEGGGRIDDATSPFPPIAHEPTTETGLRHLDGSLSMARREIGTATSAFFIAIGAQPSLDAGPNGRNKDGFGYAVFGRVTGGMDVVKAINKLPAGATDPLPHYKGQILYEKVNIIRAYRR